MRKLALILCLAAAASSSSALAAHSRTAAVPAPETDIFASLFAEEPQERPGRRASYPRRAVEPFNRQAPVHGDPEARGAGGNGGSLLAEAQRWVGFGNFTGSGRAWCADSLNAWLRATGHRTSGSGTAMSLLSVGPRVASPSPGDIAVMRGHVTVFAGWGGRGFIGLGGNQHHRVSYSSFPSGRVIAWVRPI